MCMYSIMIWYFFDSVISNHTFLKQNWHLLFLLPRFLTTSSYIFKDHKLSSRHESPCRAVSLVLHNSWFPILPLPWFFRQVCADVTIISTLLINSYLFCLTAKEPIFHPKYDRLILHFCHMEKLIIYSANLITRFLTTAMEETNFCITLNWWDLFVFKSLFSILHGLAQTRRLFLFCLSFPKFIEICEQYVQVTVNCDARSGNVTSYFASDRDSSDF